MCAYEHPEISVKFSIWTILNIRTKSEKLILSILNTAQRAIVIDILQMAEVVNSLRKRDEITQIKTKTWLIHMHIML